MWPIAETRMWCAGQLKLSCTNKMTCLLICRKTESLSTSPIKTNGDTLEKQNWSNIFTTIAEKDFLPKVCKKHKIYRQSSLKNAVSWGEMLLHLWVHKKSHRRLRPHWLRFRIRSQFYRKGWESLFKHNNVICYQVQAVQPAPRVDMRNNRVEKTKKPFTHEQT